MRVLVGVKRVVDYAVKVRIQPDKAGTLRLHAELPFFRLTSIKNSLLQLLVEVAPHLPGLSRNQPRVSSSYTCWSSLVVNSRCNTRCLAPGSTFVLLLPGVELKNAKMSMNPFCENAMEEAVKLKVRGVLHAAPRFHRV